MLGQKSEPLKILIVEDLPADAELALRAITTTGVTIRSMRVDNAQDLRRQLRDLKPDVVLSDFSMPGMTGLDALRIVREQCPDTPFIFVSGTIGEERAIDAIKDGATDYVLKEHLARLPSAVERALKETRERRARQTAEHELRETRERLESILTSLHDAVWSIAVPGEHSLFVNKAMEQIYGRPASEFIKNPNLWREVIHPDDQARVAKAWEAVYTQEIFDSEYRILRPDGVVVWVRDWARAHHTEHGDITRIDGITTDISARKQQEAHILRMNRIHAVWSEINSSIVRLHERDDLLRECCRILVDTGGFGLACIGDINLEQPAFHPSAWAGEHAAYLSERFPSGTRQNLGDGPGWQAAVENRQFICNDIAADASLPLRERLLEYGYRSLALLPVRVGGKLDAGILLYARERDFFNAEETHLLLSVAADLGYALERMRQVAQLEYLANYDPLTGLLNRDGLARSAHEHLAIARRGQQLLPWLVFNIERFDSVNESLGRQAGDQLLQEVARRLKEKFGEAVGLARVDTDQFAVVLPPVDYAGVVARFIEQRLSPLLSEPVQIADMALHPTSRVGIALAPTDGVEADALLINALAAMRKSAVDIRAYTFYSPSLNDSVAQRVALESRLRRAVSEQQFVLHYQPKVDLGSGNIVGAEALLRWQDPETGLVPPAQFIPLLEETGLIVDVGTWVMEQAVRDMQKLKQRTGQDLRIAVNVSPLQLRRPDFVDTVRQVLSKSSPCLLDIEITESIIMHDTEKTVEKLQAVREMGVTIAIDDFGTGYSSLSMISKLPINTLKIDRSFIVSTTRSPEDVMVVSTIITLGHALKMHVVAEGVDSEEQLKLLRQLRCDEIQGYLFSPPVPVERFVALLEKQR